MTSCAYPLSGAFVVALLTSYASIAAAGDLQGLTALDSAMVTDHALAKQRGRQGVQANFQIATSEQTADVTTNTLEGNINNGQNILEGNAFSGAVGLMTVVQNSGNQVVIQESTTVSIKYTPN